MWFLFFLLIVFVLARACIFSLEQIVEIFERYFHRGNLDKKASILPAKSHPVILQVKIDLIKY